MPERLYYDLVLIGGNELRVRFDDSTECSKFFDEIYYNRYRLPFVQITVSDGRQWYVRPEHVTAWRPV
jgi:hypothetical protein